MKMKFDLIVTLICEFDFSFFPPFSVSIFNSTVLILWVCNIDLIRIINYLRLPPFDVNVDLILILHCVLLHTSMFILILQFLSKSFHFLN